MPFGLLPALGSLTSITDGGAFTAPTSSAASSESVTGSVNVGGLNVPAFPGDNRALLLAGAGVAIAWFIWGRRRR